MSGMDRRQLLALGGAAVAVSSLPLAPPVAVAEAAALDPVWVVGTPGESDAAAVRAPTGDLARRFWAEDHRGEHDGDEDEAECDCGFCLAYRSAEVSRIPAWDARDENSITAADWIAQGFGCICSRCNDETDAGCAHVVVEEVICDDCMTIADWDKVDPEIAAELRAEADGNDDAPSPPSPPAPGKA